MAKISKQSAMQIAVEISELIHQHVNIMDHEGTIIASTDIKRIGDFHQGAKKVIDEQLELLIIEKDNDYEGTKKGINLPIIVEEEIVGVIGITGEKEQVELYGQIIRKMTEILVVEAYRKEEKLVTEKIRNRYIEEWLFDNSHSNHEDFVRRGRALGIDITLPRRILIATIVHEDRQDDTSEGQRMLDKVEKKVQKVIETDHITNIFLKANTKMVCIVASRNNKALQHLASSITEEIENKYHMTLAIGIDKVQDNYTMIHKAYIHAKKALTAAFGDLEKKIKFYEDITIEMFINEIPKHLKEEFVRKVFNSEENSYIEKIIPFIETFITCNGSLSSASEMLYMHKNTLQYKLNRIYEKTGYDPRNLKDIPLFYMAILFFKELNT